MREERAIRSSAVAEVLMNVYDRVALSSHTQQRNTRCGEKLSSGRRGLHGCILYHSMHVRIVALFAGSFIASALLAPPVRVAGQAQSPSLPLSPAEALKTFSMPPGYRIELVASEPLIQEPVAFDWDTEGRLWTVEMPGFMADITGSNERDPIGRVVVLEDRDRDGRMDKRTVFADGLVLARSIKVLDRGVLVAEPPNVWLMRDTDGDLKMDTRELVTDRYGRREGDPQNNANGFDWGFDNVMHTAGQANIELRLKNGAFQVLPTLQRGEWGVTHDDAGRIYRNTNESALHVDLVPTAYFARNPGLLRTRGSYERLADADPGLNVIWPARPNPGTNRAYQVGIDRADGTLEKFTAVCAPLVYRGDRLPSELYGNVFVAEPAANLVSRLVLTDDGKKLGARRAYERGEFLASTDERFRPVFLSNAPDGTLYVADMYRGIIEHRLSLTVYLRDYILGKRLDQHTGFGRIYRVVHDTTKRDVSRVLSKRTPAELVAMLSHANGWRRDTAQRLLVERGEASVAPALVRLARSAEDARTRLQALWTLDGIDAIEPAMVRRALADRSKHVRAAAIRIAEKWLGNPDHPLQSAVVPLRDDPAWEVRQQLAASIGALASGGRETAAISLLERQAADPVVVDAVLSGVGGSEADLLQRLLQSAPGEIAAPAVTMLAATIVRRAQEAPVQHVFGWIADAARPGWQRAALLHGAEVALLGTPMPGASTARNAPRTGPPLPCPTCPGGRAGPGGAYAYSKPEDFIAAGHPPSASSRRMLRINGEPASLIRVAAGAEDLSSRVTAVLDRISWPGKAGDAPLVPLTPEQQRRFDAGRDIYANLCQACHSQDGRGQDRVAPSLIDSALLLASPDIPARALLNGKEGPIGLMPPLGSTLSDEQLASVLTYVRREWGQTASPVDPAAITAVRELTRDRTRPWTHDELMKMAAERER
jgi:mono/diheme cytochrome c family protein/glucose/arabinose dehydrogenase